MSGQGTAPVQTSWTGQTEVATAWSGSGPVQTTWYIPGGVYLGTETGRIFVTAETGGEAIVLS